MDPDPFKSYPPGDPRRPPSRVFLVLLAVAVAIAVTLFAALIVYLREVWTAQPLVEVKCEKARTAVRAF